MTPFQEKFTNATKDTLFTVVVDGTGLFDAGSVVSLYYDDGTSTPLFRLVSGHCDYKLSDGQQGAYLPIGCLEEIPEVKKPMKILYDIQSVLSAAKYLEQYHEDMEREDIAKEILADIRGFAKTDLNSTSTIGYVILFDRGNEYISAEVFVTPNFRDSFFMEEEV